MSAPPLVLITRPAGQAAALAALLQKRGFRTFCEPVLEIRPLPLPPLPDAHPGALIFTSARAVEHWRNVPPGLRQIPVYAVGTKTAAALAENGFTDIAATAPSAAALEALLQNRAAQNALPARLLHICGKNRARRFHVADTKITAFPVYSAVRVRNLTKNLQSLLHNKEIDIMLFYSVRTAENFIKLSKNCQLTEKYDEITAICISTRTAEAIKDVRWKNILTAAAPDQTHILKCLDDLKNSQ